MRRSWVRVPPPACQAPGALGVDADYVALLSPWSFNPDRIATPFSVWHGAQDVRVSTEAIVRAAERIPGATFTLWQDSGHLGFAKHFDALVAASKP